MLTKFLRNMMPYSIVIFLVLTVVWCIGLVAGSFLPGNVQGYASAITMVLTVLWIISFVVMMFLMLGVSLVRSLENKVLQSFGRSGTATVQDIRTMIETGRYGHTRITGVRVKLNVHAQEGGIFEAIAEDSGDDWNNGDSEMKVGQEVPVKYDPLTKEVVLMTPKHQRVEEPEVKKPDW